MDRNIAFGTTGLFVATVLLDSVHVSLAAEPQEKTEVVGVGKAAGIGALLGVALGRDPIVGSIQGARRGGRAHRQHRRAGAGEERKEEGPANPGAASKNSRPLSKSSLQPRIAAGGLIANTVVQEQERKEKKKAQQTQVQETRQQEQQAAEVAQKANQDLERQVEEAIGKDNYEGYKALRACQHKRASALAQVGAVSENEDHRITSIWLDAMVAVDQRDSKKANQYFEEIAEKDPDIDTVQQASIETDKVVLDMRTERRELGVSCR